MSHNGASATVRGALTGKTLALWGLLGAQSVCALFFLFDVIADLSGRGYLLGGVFHEYLEFAVVLALALGIGFTSLEIRKVLRRNRFVEAQLKAASGAFAELLQEHFDGWSLTPAERDVALLAIKGLSIAEIAGLRTTKEGTIKAQCNAIYRKAGVSGRPQLISLFVEELMGDGVLAAQPPDPDSRGNGTDRRSAA